MIKIILKKKGKVVGDLGEYENEEEAKSIMNSYNIKSKRRGAVAEIERTNPKRSLGSLFGGSIDDDSESEFESESESESDSYDEYSGDMIPIDQSQSDDRSTDNDVNITSPVPKKEQSLYRNPLDLWPTYTQQKKEAKNPRRESITKKRKRISRKFKAPHAISVQAIMIDDDGYVLIRKPSNRYRGINWEFYGGKVNGGEDIEEALNRELQEETGYKVEIQDKIGEISIDGGFQKYFLVRPQSQIQQPSMETENTYWVAQDEAWELLGKNKDPYKRKYRSILDKAYSIWRTR